MGLNSQLANGHRDGFDLRYSGTVCNLGSLVFAVFCVYVSFNPDSFEWILELARVLALPAVETHNLPNLLSIILISWCFL